MLCFTGCVHCRGIIVLMDLGLLYTKGRIEFRGINEASGGCDGGDGSWSRRAHGLDPHRRHSW